MNTEEWGVTERGFHRPTYVELLDAVEYKARELFGNKANLTVRLPPRSIPPHFRLDAQPAFLPDGGDLQFQVRGHRRRNQPLQPRQSDRPVSAPSAEGVRLRYLHWSGRHTYPDRLPGSDRGRSPVRRPHRRPHRVRWHRHPSCSGRRNRRGLQCGSGPDLGDHQPAGRR